MSQNTNNINLDDLKQKLSSIPIDINKQIIDGYTNYISNTFYYDYYKISNYVDKSSMQKSTDPIYAKIIENYNNFIQTIENRIFISLLNDSFYNIMYYSYYESIFQQMILNALSSVNISLEEKQYLLKLIKIYYKNLHTSPLDFNNKINIFRLIAEFVEIGNYDKNFQSLLKSTDYSNNILNNLLPITSSNLITFYDLIKYMLGDKINYSLYDLINGYTFPLPSNIIFNTDEIGIFSLLQYMRISDIMNIFIGNGYTQQQFINESIIPTDQNISLIRLGKQTVKNNLALTFSKICNSSQDSINAMSTLLLLNKLQIQNPTLSQNGQLNGQLNGPLMGTDTYTFLNDVFRYFYQYVLVTDIEFISKCKELLISIYDNLNATSNRTVNYVINRIKLLFDKDSGIIVTWIKNNGSIYRSSTSNIKVFYNSFFDTLEQIINQIILILVGKEQNPSSYTNPIKSFIQTMISYAKQLIDQNLPNTLINYIGMNCLIDGYQIRDPNNQIQTIDINMIFGYIDFLLKQYQIIPYLYEIKIAYQSSTSYNIISDKSSFNCSIIPIITNTNTCTNLTNLTNPTNKLDNIDATNYINDIIFQLLNIINIAPGKIVNSITDSPLDYVTILLNIISLVNSKSLVIRDDILNSLYSGTNILSDSKLDKLKQDDIINLSDQTNFSQYRDQLKLTYQNILNKFNTESELSTVLIQQNYQYANMIKYKLNEISKNIDLSLFNKSIAKICAYKPYNIVKHFNSIVDIVDNITDPLNSNINLIIRDDKINLYPYFILSKYPYKYDDNTTLVSTIRSKPIISNASINTTVYNTNTNDNGNMIVSFQSNNTEPIKINIELNKEDITYS